MVNFLLLLLLGVQSSAAVTHSLKYFHTALSGVQNFPEFVAVVFVDEEENIYYESDYSRAVPRQDWMNKITDVDPQYWDRETYQLMDSQQFLKDYIEILKQRFNQTRGVHYVQQMYGCQWDDETGEVRGYRQYGYDGEDFIALDLKSESWTAAKQQAVVTKQEWDNDKDQMAIYKNYLLQECPDWLKKYVDYGRSSLMRTVVPSVSLLQKTSSSPVSCHATGFYPQRAELMWRKDGEEIHKDVVKGEILPNNDGTFQMTVDLSSVKPEDWNKYECVFQLRGEPDLVTRLEAKHVRRNEGSFLTAAVVGVVIGLLVLVGIIYVGVMFWRKRNNGFKRTNTSDISSSSSSVDQDFHKENIE